MSEDVTAEQLESIVSDNDVGESLRETLEDAFSDTSFSDDDQTPEPEEDKVEEETKSEKDKSDDAQPDDGEDAPEDDDTDPESEVEETPPEDEDQTETDQAKDAKDQDGAPGSLTAPGTWSAEEKAEFANLPEKVQATVLRREGDRDRAFSQKQAEMNQKAQSYKAMDQVFEPYDEVLAMNGVDKPNLIRQYLAYDKALANDPVGTLKTLASRVGVDLSSLNQEAEGEEASPQFLALKRELEETRQTVNSFQTERQQQEALLSQQRQQDLIGQLTTFAQSTDETGNLKYPHFEELRVAMGALMDSGQAPDMDSAYNQALWGSPNHRDSLLAAQRRELEKSTKAVKAAHAKKAVKAAVSVSGSPGGAEPPASVGTIREELEKAAQGL